MRPNVVAALRRTISDFYDLCCLKHSTVTERHCGVPKVPGTHARVLLTHFRVPNKCFLVLRIAWFIVESGYPLNFG